MSHPFQCISIAKAGNSSHRGYLLAANGARLTSTSLGSGEVISRWMIDQREADGAESERPAKKQRTEPPAATGPNIIKLVVSETGQHAVLATDDKFLRVFEIQHNGQLLELSQRCMSKRPCALQILPDNSTILCGDKFGDVYSLPLLSSPTTSEEQPKNDSEPQDSTSLPKLFKPSASALTVHTKRNRRALEAQLKQQHVQVKGKEPMAFEHKLLLGHVSMLTDLAFATRVVDGQSRSYIITADRDEHIRISRGPPQSHVIEGYCLGHTEFISKVCLIPKQDLLISGGGDDWLGIWEWPISKLRHRLNPFRAAMNGNGNSNGQPNGSETTMTISGIWTVPVRVGQDIELAVAVACEKSPTLALIPLSELSKKDTNDVKISVVHFDHPIIDLISTGDTVIVSMDSRENASKRLCAYTFDINEQDDNPRVIAVPSSQVDCDLSVINADKGKIEDNSLVDDLLYSLGNLRKRTGHRDGEDGAEDKE